jgi:excisionase family DNA binding protein
MANLEQFLTVKQAAKFLGVAPNTLRNWDRDRRIPVYRHPISNYRLFKREDLEEVLQQIHESGRHPTGWQRPEPGQRSRTKPR